MILQKILWFFQRFQRKFVSDAQTRPLRRLIHLISIKFSSKKNPLWTKVDIGYQLLNKLKKSWFIFQRSAFVSSTGTFWGYIESYLFWFLEDMGGTKSLMGLTLTISALSGIPALLISDYVFRKIGHPNVQVIGFIFYVFRLFGTRNTFSSPTGGT